MFNAEAILNPRTIRGFSVDKKTLYFKASEGLSFVKEGMPFSVFAEQQIAVGRHRPDFTVSDLF